MHYELRFSQSAEDDLRALDRAIEKHIVRKLREYLESGVPMRFAKPLVGQYQGFYRFRVGDYRVIFHRLVDGSLCILRVVAVGHRSDIYTSP